MRHILNLLAAIAAIFIISACDYLQPDAIPTAQGIFFSNKGKLSGTYVVTGAHSYIEKTTDFLPSLPDGEYHVFFTTAKVSGNICYFDGINPAIVGNTKFVVSSSDKAQSVLVPINEITCHLSFKAEDGVKFSKAVVTDIPDSMYIDGELGQPKNLTFYKDCYVIATRMKVFISVDIEDLNQPMKVLEGVIDAQPGHKYILKLGKDGISVSE